MSNEPIRPPRETLHLGASWGKGRKQDEPPKARTVLRRADPESRVKDVRERLMAHFERHQATWIGREVVRLTAKHIGAGLHHPTPMGTRRVPPMTEIHNQARWTIAGRITRRLSALNAIETRLQEKREPQRLQRLRVSQGSSTDHATVFRRKMS